MSILGGGMLGQLIMFFTKRHDEKKAKRIVVYNSVHAKLSKYNNILTEILLDFFRKNNIRMNKIEESLDLIECKANKKLIRTIKRQHRECKKGEYPGREICDKCQQIRLELREIDEKLSETESMIKQNRNYWQHNYDEVKSLIVPYMNISNDFIPVSKFKTKLRNAIRDVDNQSACLLTYLLGKHEDEMTGFPNEIIKQMEKIAIALYYFPKF